ncbi:MAG TPA: MFS transporter, partial [Actinomycetota bacterium]|nr:MFS transporter [Actinomycetota bacterium]
MADAFPEAGPLGEARPKARHPAVRALSNRPFRLFFIGNLISQTGTFLQSAALAVLVFDLTGTNAAVGLTNAATFLPVLALALVGGELADRFNRRRLFLVTQVVSTIAVAALAALTAAGRVTPGWIYALAGVLGLCYAVAIPTMHSLIPSLVPPADLGPSIGLTSVTFNAARIIGPAVASAAIAGLGFAGAFGLNALSFVPMIVALALIRVTPRAADRPRVSLVEGVRYAWREPAVRGMLLAVASIAFAFDPVMTLAPGFARRVFGHSGAAAPVLMAAFGVGSVLSAAFLGRMFRRPEANVRRGSATLFLLGAGMAGFALSPTFEVGVAMLLVAGLGSLSSVTLFTTGLQQIVSED